VSAQATATSLPSAPVLAAAFAGALLALAAVLVLLRRRPELFAPLAVAALPFRLPISSGGRTVNLLIPLYVVVAAGCLQWLIERRPLAAGVEWARLRAPRAWLSSDGVALLLGISVVLYALQGTYSSDHTKAAENVAFFYIPFGLLFVLLRSQEWSRELLLRCLGVAVVIAVLLAGVGFIEYARKSLFLNPKVVAANQYDNYFRVNSLFFDPNIYGRFLALVMIAVTAVVLWSARRRDVLIGSAVLAWLLAALVTSFSQSSIAALLLGLALLAGWRWDARLAAYGAFVVLALGGALVLLAPASLHFGLKGSGGSTSNATSGRTKLISGGLELFAQRPLEGYGSGSFETEYKRHGNADAQNATSASHTIPITVAAEQGIVGLAVYIALLVAAFFVLFRGAGRSPPFRPNPGDTRLRLASPFRPAVAACFAALVLHTWAYADFLEDPFTWALLAIGLALADADRRAGLETADLAAPAPPAAPPAASPAAQ
jgi:O-antigen ligase